ncbi:MAG: gamma-glutamyltransferase [Streptosporangiaceae bacterium]
MEGQSREPAAQQRARHGLHGRVEPSGRQRCRLRSAPLSGALAVAVPGAPAALKVLHDRGATRGLEELWAPAARAAERGLPCTAKTRGEVLEYETELRADPGMMNVYLRDGRAPAVGGVLPNPDLARSIRLLSADPGLLLSG